MCEKIGGRGLSELSPKLSDAREEKGREERTDDDDEDNEDVGDDALRRRSTDDDDDETMWETKSEDLYKYDAGGDER